MIEFPEARIVVVNLEILSQNLALQARTPPFPHKMLMSVKPRQQPELCGSRKYPYPHHGGNWKFRRGGGGGSKAQENPEERVVERINYFPEGQLRFIPMQASYLVRKLLLTEFVDLYCGIKLV